MEPLIVTATPNISWLNPEVKYPMSPEEFAEEAKQVEKAGASIIHIHAQGMWTAAIREIRKSSNLIIQCGMSSLSLKERLDVFTEKADMISIMLGHHDEAFVKQDFHVLHPREELLEYASLTKKYGVKPEFEVWHTGHIWNLNYLINKGAVQMPYFATLFFGWPGGNWTPPTIEEYLYRRRQMPTGGVINVSVMGKEQIKVLTASIIMGDHVRVGTEDNPFIGDRLATNAELVAQIVDIAKSIGRKIASPSEAAKIIGISR